MSKLVHMDDQSMLQLVADIKEMPAKDAGRVKSSIKVVELWKILRRKKSATRIFSSRRNHIPFT